MVHADRDIPGWIILLLLTLDGIALWMNYYGFLGKRPRSKVRRLIKKYLVPLSLAEIKYFPTETQMFRNLRELTLVLVFTYDFDIVKISLSLRRLSSSSAFGFSAIEDNKGRKRK
ncbi:uncharacterized protein LOC107767885 isoform X2 [Nicotiana tabacum]|uniref:Uncharacterized protein LOC107767885 isoform X2 n=1 Tax=Nicotiana tabacum TaxID=4097 RepID=A0AC58SQS4_TOBAC